MASEQLGFDLGERPKSGPVYFDPVEIRADLIVMLTEAQEAITRSPWDERTFKYNRLVFPQMAKWLPDDEAAQLVLAFRQEVARIELLLAA